LRPSARDFAEFNGLLRSVVEKGLPLPPAMHLIAGIVRHQALRQALNGAASALEEGASLHDALSKHPDVFPAEYCALLRSGVESGRLAEALGTAQTHQALRVRLESKLRRLFLYILGAVIVGEVVLGITLIVGRHMEYLFEQLEIRQLPELTMLFVGAGHSGWGILLGWPVFFLLMVLAWKGIQRYARLGWVGYCLPVWGPVQKSTDLAKFCCALGLRLRSGAPLVEALRSGRDAVANRRFRRFADQVIGRVDEGQPLSSALYYHRFFPKTLAWGISLGEENGELVRCVDAFTALYTAQMERRYESLYEILPPLGILIVGNLAFLCALSMFLPIIQIQQKLSN
jgi:type IV pilus assembly protein PilC